MMAIDLEQTGQQAKALPVAVRDGAGFGELLRGRLEAACAAAGALFRNRSMLAGRWLAGCDAKRAAGWRGSGNTPTLAR